MCSPLTKDVGGSTPQICLPTPTSHSIFLLGFRAIPPTPFQKGGFRSLCDSNASLCCFSPRGNSSVLWALGQGAHPMRREEGLGECVGPMRAGKGVDSKQMIPKLLWADDQCPGSKASHATWGNVSLALLAMHGCFCAARAIQDSFAVWGRVWMPWP